MAQIQNLKITIGDSIENVVLDTAIRLPGQPPAPAVPCRKVTLKFDMIFSEGEIGLNYRLSAILYANDRAGDDLDDGVSFLPFSEDVGLTTIQNLTATDRRWSLFSSSYETVPVTSTRTPKEIIKYVRQAALDEDPKVDFYRPPHPRPWIVAHNDELLARVTISHVAEEKSVPATL
jgi:hypothetical protein